MANINRKDEKVLILILSKTPRGIKALSVRRWLVAGYSEVAGLWEGSIYALIERGYISKGYWTIGWI